MTALASFSRQFLLQPTLMREGKGTVLRHYGFFMKSQFWTRQQLLDYQSRKLSDVILHAYNSVDYYKSLFNDSGIDPHSIKYPDDLAKLPILTRDIISENLDSLISQGIDKSSMQRVLTGGTTGKQATICRDRESSNIKMGSAYRFESFMGRQPADKLALFWPARADFSHKPSFLEKIKNRFITGDLPLFTGNYDARLFRQYCREIIDFKPVYFKVFPSALSIYINFLENEKLAPFKLSGIMTTGEPLYDHQKTRFENTFRCPVYNLYSSREAGNTACECSMHTGLHIAMETTIVEYVENSRLVPDGKIGDILITDLTNFAMPLIRYKIDDTGARLNKGCSCGRGLELMSPVVGRLTDDFYSPDGRRHSGNTLGFYLTTNSEFPIGQMQIIQETLLDFKVIITDRPVPDQRIFDFIISQMNEIIGQGINIHMEVVRELPREKSGKLRFVKCNYKPGNQAA